MGLTACSADVHPWGRRGGGVGRVLPSGSAVESVRPTSIAVGCKGSGSLWARRRAARRGPFSRPRRANSSQRCRGRHCTAHEDLPTLHPLRRKFGAGAATMLSWMTLSLDNHPLGKCLPYVGHQSHSCVGASAPRTLKRGPEGAQCSRRGSPNLWPELPPQSSGLHEHRCQKHVLRRLNQVSRSGAGRAGPGFVKRS